MNRQTACEIYRRLLEQYPIQGGKRHFIEFENPYEALILTILSAQTTDRAVNEVRDAFFARYPTPEALARAEPEEIEPLIQSIGVHHSKSRYVVETARKLVSEFDSEVPRTMEELQSFPGVGRKTANIVLSHAFGINVGIAVDTHVRRVSQRIGFTDSTNQDVIERDLMALFPQEAWRDINYLLIRFGREICSARNPKHEECVVSDLCRFYREHHTSKGTDQENGARSPRAAR